MRAFGIIVQKAKHSNYIQCMTCAEQFVCQDQPL